jgi:ABC-2 type transport system permease protein
VYKAFVTSAIARELQFRANFFAKIFQNVIWVGFYTVLLLVVYSKTKLVAGWTQGDSFVLSGTVVLLEVLSRAFFNGLNEIPEQVRKGTLDFVVTRPIDSQFWVSTRRFYFDQLGPALAGVAMVLVGLRLTGTHPSGLDWLLWGTQFLLAMAIFYSFQLMLMTISIWLIRVDNLFVLAETATQVARNPLQIYSGGVQQFLIYILPLGLLGTIPAQALLGRGNLLNLLTALVWAVVSLLGARAFWQYAARSYSSASS